MTTTTVPSTTETLAAGGQWVTGRHVRRTREPVHVVSQRPGHASAVTTMTVHPHVLPGSQREAADRFVALVGGAYERQADPVAPRLRPGG
jgi:hypothetical protein